MLPLGRKNRTNAPKSRTPKSKGVGKKTPTIRESIEELDDIVKSLKLGFHRENRTHRAEQPNVEVPVGLGPMPPDAMMNSS